MQAWRKGSTLFAAFLVLVFAFAVITAFSYNERARAAPLVIAVPGFLLMLGWLAMEATGRAASKKKKQEELAITAQASGAAEGALTLKKVAFRESAAFREIESFLWIGGLFVLVYLLGFSIGIPLFTFLFMKVRSHDGWAVSIALPIIAWLIMYFLFGQVARFTLYEGLIPLMMAGS